MSLAIIDAREWQNMFDLRTGVRREAQGPVVAMAREVLARHPYPGDMDERSNRWVTDAALDLVEKYDPRFVFLTYAQQYFAARYALVKPEDRQEMVAAVFQEVSRFLRKSGFDYLVMGTGGMVPLAGLIDLSRLDGLAVVSHWSARYAGLHGPSAHDLKRLQDHPSVEGIMKREEFLDLFGGKAEDGLRAPDYVALAREGYMFKAAGATMRVPLMVPASSYHIPVSTGLAPVHGITGIRDMVEAHLESRNVALIVLEGIGTKDFLWPWNPCDNGKGWYYYEPGDGQYLAAATGRHCVFDYPVGYKYFDEDGPEKKYPLSGYFREIPADTIGNRFSGRSIAVGNKSMFMHVVTGADVTLECFARNLYNQGTMAVIHRHDKMGEQAT